MYGTRGAGQNWQHAYSQTLIDAGFAHGKASPCISYHAGKDLTTYVHGDDYVTAGTPEAFKWLKKTLEAKYELKTEILGAGVDGLKEVRVLN